ncbi:MAG: hypothetical protein QNJ38_22495 [Prochloraceae cyanobacterium]|nr:hypothetical protein [Prochloraceae cyanobacterium]
MNVSLVRFFKDYCNGRLKELIDSCYLRIDDRHTVLDLENEFTSICEIYTPLDLAEELNTYQQELTLIGDLLNIEFLYIIPIIEKNLLNLHRQATISNDVETWRTYLELQYLF